jgi:pyridoxal phosphate enzyme (YggS family)
MDSRYRERVKKNYLSVMQRIADAAIRSERNPESICLVSVTKSVGLDEVRTLSELGCNVFGENRPEYMGEKVAAFPDAHWHMIGSVQRRKASEIVTYFSQVDSIDRVEVAEALQRRCEELDRTLDILVEANVSGEESKHGFTPDLLPDIQQRIKALDRLRLRGLMTMAPYVADPEEARPVFRRLAEWGARLGLPELSMGMTNDFEVAIEEGATQVRVGSALFE